MNGDLCLQWNNYSASFTKQSKKLFLKDGLSDGTIFCDGSFYPIHRFVLSSCSEYFEEVFEKSFQISNKETFIIIKDIAAEQMDELLKYMYLGEVQVSQENLPQLIKAAEALRIRGLGIPDVEDFEPTRKSKRKRLKTTESVAQRTEETQESNSLNNGSISLQTYILTNDIKTESVDANLEPLNTEQEYIVKEEVLQEFGGLFAQEEMVEEQNLKLDSSQLSDSLLKDKMAGEEVGSLEQDYAEFNNGNPIDKNISDQAGEQFGSLEQDDAEFNNANPIDKNVSDQLTSSTTKNNSSIITEDQQFHCTFCSYKCSLKRILRKHLRTHKEENIFKCQICNSKFEHERDLKSHLLTHGEEKHFQCNLCPYSSSFKSHLMRHIRIHTGEKPFKCFYCPYKSSDKASLVKHVRIHTGEKPFKCSLCPYKSSDKSSLVKHIRNHTGEKPFKCLHCPYKTYKSTFVSHFRTHT